MYTSLGQPHPISLAPPTLPTTSSPALHAISSPSPPTPPAIFSPAPPTTSFIAPSDSISPAPVLIPPQSFH